MAASVTVTGTSGPGKDLTAQVFTDVEAFTFVNGKELLILNRTGGVTTYIDISTQTTLTLTVSGTTYTLTVA